MAFEHQHPENLEGQEVIRRCFGQLVPPGSLLAFAEAWKALATAAEQAGIDPKLFPQLEAFMAGNFIGAQDATDAEKFEAIDLTWQMIWHGAQASGMKYGDFLRWLDRKNRKGRRA